MTRPFLLADDLSGALEAGAPFRAAGWKVVLPLVPGAESRPGSDQLTVVSSETRALGAADAAATVRRVVAGRLAAGESLLFKKIDSTLRGPLGAELSAVVEELSPRLVVVCPANPGAGRTVEQGILKVHGVPLAETDFRRDPGWPAVASEVRSVLGGQGVGICGDVSLAALAHGETVVRTHIAALSRAGRGTCIVTSDALVQKDIRTLVLAALAVERDTIFVGSGAMGLVLAELHRPAHPVALERRPPDGSMVVLCGSRHPASHRQIDVLARDCAAAVLVTSPGADLAGLVATAVTALDAGRPVAVKCDPALASVSSGAITDWMAQVACALAGTRGPGTFYLTGGETAHAVCRKLGGSSLEIIRALDTGIVLCRLTRPHQPEVSIITKPGGYGNAQTMAFHFHEIAR